MLIKREDAPSQPVGLQPSAMAEQPKAIQPATHNEPVKEPASPLTRIGRGNEPTLAPPRPIKLPDPPDMTSSEESPAEKPVKAAAEAPERTNRLRPA